MLIIEHSVSCSASPQAIWPLYTSTENWPIWDHAIESAHLSGEFKAGATGQLQVKDGPLVKFLVTQCDPYRGFSDTSFLPLTKLIFTHTLTPKAGKTVITHHVVMRGLLAPLFAILIGRKIKAELPKAMEKLARTAEERARQS